MSCRKQLRAESECGGLRGDCGDENGGSESRAVVGSTSTAGVDP